MHAFIYQDSNRTVRLRLSDGLTASFNGPLAWLCAMSFAVARGATIEYRT